MENFSIDVLGWVATILVVLGFWFNSKGSFWGFVLFIVGDVSWVIYDFLIKNPQHALLSFVIILINIKGLWAYLNTYKKKKLPEVEVKNKKQELPKN